VWSIIEEREKKGIYKDIFDFAERVNLRSVNKKTFEVLAMAGAFDCFPDINRRQYLEAPADDLSVIEKVIKFAQKTQMEKDSAQVSLFGGVGGEEIPRPKIPTMEPFSNIMQLNIEKEVVGLYISGHPLDAFRLELSQFCNAQMANLTDMAAILNQDLRLAGIVTGLQHRTTKTGKPFGSLTLEDYSGSFQFMLFGDDYMKFKNYMVDGAFLYIRGKSTEQKWGNRGPEFKIQSIDLLHDIREKLCKSIHLSIATHHVNEELISFLEDVLTSHKGQCQVKLNIVDTEENIVVEMLAKRFRINPENAFLEKLKSRPELEMRLN
jgi:DNA polymerase III subunit alpha